MNSIYDYSNPKVVYENARHYLGNDVIIKLSDKPLKKYMILNPHTNKWVYFGQMGYEDFTKGNVDSKKRENYMRRTANIRGQWRNDKYSPNMLSRCILWAE